MAKSYDELESRIGVLERKLEFVMTFMAVQKQEGTVSPVMVKKTFLDLYYETVTGIADRPQVTIPKPDAPVLVTP